MIAPLDLSLGWPNQAIGNAKTATPVFPIKLSALVLDGYSSDQAFAGNVYIDDLEAISYAGASQSGSSAPAAPATTSTQPPPSPATGSAVPASPAIGSAAPASPAAGQAVRVTDFENWGTWKRGDEAWGTFTQSADQKQSGRFSGKFEYSFPAGEPNNYVVFRRTLPIAGKPAALRLQVLGDGSTHFLNTWIQDAKNQLWQFSFGRINHQGWQAMEASLDPSLGWPNQPIGHAATSIAYPVKLYALVLDGYTSDQAFSGVIYVDDLEAVSR